MEDVSQCPYCASTSSCAHLLLLVDKTFRTAIGGSLMQAFNGRWSNICEAGGDDFAEREPFDDLLDEVDGLADYANDYEVDGGPGSFSEYGTYFIKSEASASDVLRRFTSADGEGA